MSDYTPEDLVRLISMPGVTVEEIRLALNLPLEGFFGLLLHGPENDRAFAEVKKAAVEAFGESSSQKLMVLSDNWTIDPLPVAEQMRKIEDFRDRIEKEMEENPSGRTYRTNLKGVEGTVYHSEHKLEDLEKAIQARQNEVYRNQKIDDPAWWEFVGPALKTTADEKLYTDAVNAMRYYDNAKKEAREDENPDDFDKQIEWVDVQRALGCSMTDVSGWIFFWTMMFCAVAAVILGVASFGNYFFGWW